MRRLAKPLLVGLVALATSCLSACNALLNETTADAAAIGGGVLAAEVTENALAASAIVVGVRALAVAGLNVLERQVHGIEQQSIADAAAPLADGEVALWDVGDNLATTVGRGEVTVVRAFGSADLRCKEILFSLDEAEARAFYVAFICEDRGQWRWAVAEPATARWGTLQ